MRKRLTALFLALALLLPLCGCQTKPEQTQPLEATQAPETTAPPDPMDTFGTARDLLEGVTEITLKITHNTTMTLNGQVFQMDSSQQLTYSGEGESLQIAMEEWLDYGENRLNGTVYYGEVWSDGILYTQTEGQSFSANLTLEEAKARYTPVVLLNPELYSDIASRPLGDKYSVTFSGASEGEAWAVPEGARLIEAEGQALVSRKGLMKEMTYTAVYAYGPAEYRVEVKSVPQVEPVPVELPEAPEDYRLLQYPDALRSFLEGVLLMLQSESVTASGMESIHCQAAGVLQNQVITMDLYGISEGILMKKVYDVYLNDYGNGEEYEQKQEDTYGNGRYVTALEGRVPTTRRDVGDQQVMDASADELISCLVEPEYWQEAMAEDMGSVYLVTYSLSDAFSADAQNRICELLWNDAGYLNNRASAYKDNELTGYYAFEKYTGIPVSAGFYYEGSHTIDGYDYLISSQGDQSFVVPSYGAYHEITDRWLPEEEPENKATPLFYHVTGENGQEMWLLGTIHVGDERTGFLPQEIYDAFAASDALALECDTETFDRLAEENEELREQLSDYYYYSDGYGVASFMDEETYGYAVKMMKASGNYNMNAPYMKMSLWSSALDNFHQKTGHYVTAEQGMEERLIKLAGEQEKEILEVESSEFQIKMITGWSDELQAFLLSRSLWADAEESWQELKELYELWCAGDEEAMRKELSDQVDTSEMTEEELAEYEQYKHLVEEYNRTMSYDRNDGMLEVAIEYLESGETVFYAVGLAHLLNEVNGLVDTLREAGYTVELVTYAG